MSDLSIRTFRDGDEPAIVELFNRVYDGYGGFVPRTVEYWRWCCLERPDVKRVGIFLALAGESLYGYLVAGSSGNIWEFCVIEDDREVAEVLLEQAMSYLEKVGVSSVNVNVVKGTGVAETLQKVGFGEAPGGEMFATTLSPVGLVQALVAPQKEILVKEFDDDFGFRLHDVPFGVDKEFSVKIHNAFVEVDEGFPAEPSIVVELGARDLVSVLFGGSSAVRLFLAGKIKVRPFRKLSTVLALLSTICLRNSWYFPLSDFM